MFSRRQILQASALLTASLAGCSSDSDKTEPPTSTPAAQKTETPPTTAEVNVLDIRDFGAEVDGKTDDTEAVRDTLDAASRGDTVFFPAGTTRVGDGYKRSVWMDSTHSGITLKGTGESSIIKQAGGHTANNQVLYIEGDTNPEDITIRDLRVHGNRANNANRTTHGFLAWPAGDTRNILVENVWVENCSATAFQASTGGVRFNRCTARHNTMHGFNPDTATPRRRIEVTNVLSHHNRNYGIDDSSGNSYINGFVVHNCTYGMKNTRDTKQTVIKNGVIRNCDTNGYTVNIPSRKWPSYRPNVTIDNVLSEGHGNWAFRFSANATFDIGAVEARNSNKNQNKPGQVAVVDDSEVKAADLRSYNAVEGAGLFYSSGQDSKIQNFYHTENPAGGIVGPAAHKLDIVTEQPMSLEDIGTVSVPSVSSVGAREDQVSEKPG